MTCQKYDLIPKLMQKQLVGFYLVGEQAFMYFQILRFYSSYSLSDLVINISNNK